MDISRFRKWLPEFIGTFFLVLLQAVYHCMSTSGNRSFTDAGDFPGNTPL
jgi:hypothetical protein